MVLLIVCGCGPSRSPGDTPPASHPQDDTVPHDPADSGEPGAVSWPVVVTVTLDGVVAEGVTVSQGGNPARWTTNAQGQATVQVDAAIEGDQVIVASHPEARIGGVDIPDPDVATAVTIALVRYDPRDNPDYVFQDPGEPTRSDSTLQCLHCHVTIGADWFDSAHRSAASRPQVHDLYAGTAAAFADASTCAAAGGTWWEGLSPGSGGTVSAGRCYIGLGALPVLNPDCGVTAPCDGVAADLGGCADCHAPGIDGVLGGRDLLEAEGHAYNYGIHCDTCHRVESVDLSAAPGVAGRLVVHRPREPAQSAGMGDWQPLTFGPGDDVPNPRMGVVTRALFREADFCAGCHQHDAAPGFPGASLDRGRWPDGRLPIQSTYAEWLAGPFADAAPCQSCHMPPDPSVGNSADLQLLPEGSTGVAGGWWRPPGQVRRHTWSGPRSTTVDMLSLAAEVQLARAPTPAGDALQISATVRNIGPGHALPTGEAMRTLILRVEARCTAPDALLVPTGGDVVSTAGDALEQRSAGEDWTRWSAALPGQRLRITTRPGTWVDYTGFGPFGDGTFSAEQKGLPQESFLAERQILAVDAEGTVTLDAPLPEGGDHIYRVDGVGLPEDGAEATAWAGAPGFAFARLLVDPAGERVPHFAAVDVSVDNRLLPQQGWTSQHTFDLAGCRPEDTVAEARLLYRPYPLALARERGWPMTETVMAQVTR